MIPMIERRQTFMPTSSKLPYLVATVTMAIVGVTACTVISILRPEEDNMPLMTVMIGFIVTTTTSILAFWKSSETHAGVNGRMDAMLHAYRLQMHAEGVREGEMNAVPLQARLDQLEQLVREHDSMVRDRYAANPPKLTA